MEKYGVIPKRFTKDWWEYFWEYYKWHVIIGILLIFMTGVTIFQFATKINYDAVVTYIGAVSYDEESVEEISSAFEKIIPDINGNGKTDVQFQVLAVAKPNSEFENPQYTMGIETKKTFEIQTGESYLFIADKQQVQEIYANHLADGIFSYANEWLNEKNSLAEHAPAEAGEFFVKISDISFFKARGFETEELYLGIRNQKIAEETSSEMEAAVKLANYLLG